MDTQRYTNWIFDWSGTLVDDLGKVVDATNNVMRAYEKPCFNRESFKSSFRLPYGEWYSEILPDADIEDIEVLFRAGFLHSTADIPVLKYARELLETLKKQQVRMFTCTSVDTNSFIEHANENGLLPYFEKTYSGVKDKRELIGDILEKNALNQHETLFVGDMTHDIDTAHYGSIDSLAVLTGYNTKEELETSKPTYILENYSSLIHN